MTQFKDLSDEQLKSVGNELILKVLRRVSNQVPIPSRNPFSKGELQRSLTYDWEFNGEVWSLIVNYVDHGKYSLFGTRMHRDTSAESTSWFGRDFKAYRQSKGGVRPQYWLSLRGDRPEFDTLIRDELNIVMKTFLNHTISDFAKKANA